MRWLSAHGGILLGEPTNHLDIRHQLDLLSLLAATDQTVLHDLSLAARFCDHLVLMHQGKVTATGLAQQVLTTERLRDVFEVDAEINHDSMGNLTVVYRGTTDRVGAVNSA